MNKIAVISDIHGNLPALEAVLTDIQARGADEIICLGDLIGKGPFGPESVDLTRDSCDYVIQGNWDHFLPDNSYEPGPVFWRDQLNEAQLDYLRGLPFCYDLQMGGRQIRMYHASQKSIYFRVYPSSGEEIHQALFENSEATGLDRPLPDTVLYGDIHAAYLLPFQRNKQIINVGSVGNPLDITLATYVMLNEQRSNGSLGLNVEFVRVPYDIEQVIAHAKALKMPETEELAMELRTGVYRGATRASQ